MELSEFLVGPPFFFSSAGYETSKDHTDGAKPKTLLFHGDFMVISLDLLKFYGDLLGFS